mmetsp:Transcript_44963/g.139319  ORF Transcript_44963/g.139319 Transcript_44963/m.139319 type:complete len:329 (-) Transcript_44963:992-1978(-)
MATTSPSLSPRETQRSSALVMLVMASSVRLQMMCTWATPRCTGTMSRLSPCFCTKSIAFSCAFIVSSARLVGTDIFGSPTTCSTKDESWIVAMRQKTVAWLSLSSSSFSRACAFLVARSAGLKFIAKAWTSATSKRARASQRLSFSFWKRNCASVAAETAWSSSSSVRCTVHMTMSARPSAFLSPDFVSSSLASLAARMASDHFSRCMWTMTARCCDAASSAGSSSALHTGAISRTQASVSVNSLRSNCTRPMVCSNEASILRSWSSREMESASSARGSALSESFSSRSVLARRSSASISRRGSPASRKPARAFLMSFTPASGSLFCT